MIPQRIRWIKRLSHQDEMQRQGCVATHPAVCFACFGERMANFFLISILIVTMAVPIRFARSKSARLGLRRVAAAMAIYVFVWVLYCMYLFQRLGAGY